MHPTSVAAVAHMIQLALTPVFLLSGVAALMNVFSTRLARVADQVDALGARIDAGQEPDDSVTYHQLRRLRRRSLALDWAVILGAIAGAATCGATLTLFLGSVGGEAAAWVLFGLFGAAVLCTIGALAAFSYEMTLSSHTVRAKVQRRTG